MGKRVYPSCPLGKGSGRSEIAGFPLATSRKILTFIVFYLLIIKNNFLIGGVPLATHASALKRARQSERRRIRNVSVKSGLKTHTKRVLQAVESKNREEARKALTHAIPALQKAAAKGVIHKKTAARKISLLTRKVNTLAS
jgi:small subunit ribosomal protein S20